MGREGSLSPLEPFSKDPRAGLEAVAEKWGCPCRTQMPWCPFPWREEGVQGCVCTLVCAMNECENV